MTIVGTAITMNAIGITNLEVCKMFRTMGRRTIASTVGFFLGWAVFLIVTPVRSLPVIEAPARQILSITLKHQGCTDPLQRCPVYDLTFHSDGSAIYTGYADDDFMGNHTAYISLQDYRYLTDQLEKQRFLEMPQHYGAHPTQEIIVLEVVTNEGPRRVTAYNWASTPFELRALHALIAEQVYHLDWYDAD